MSPEEKSIIKRKVCRIDNWVSAGLENGLFKGENKEKYCEINSDFKQIIENLDNEEYKYAEGEKKSQK